MRRIAPRSVALETSDLIALRLAVAAERDTLLRLISHSSGQQWMIDYSLRLAKIYEVLDIAFGPARRALITIENGGDAAVEALNAIKLDK